MRELQPPSSPNRTPHCKMHSTEGVLVDLVQTTQWRKTLADEVALKGRNNYHLWMQTIDITRKGELHTVFPRL